MKIRVIHQISIIILIFICAICNSDGYENINITERDKVYTYENDNIGMALSFPVDWKNQCIVSETENNINVYHKEVYEEYAGAGLLFSIDRVVGELITDEDLSQDPEPKKILLQGNGYTFLLRVPSDIQYPLDDEELRKDYENLAEMIPTVCKTIYLIDMRNPKTLNAGYKVVGSSFFTMEIPNEWKMEFADDSLGWLIYDDKTMIGRVEQVPYHAGASFNEGIPEYSANYVTEVIADSSRAFQIVLNKKKVSQTQMNKIKGSFCFKSGPYTVIDAKSNAEEYLSQGGKKLFGSINEFEYKDGEPVAVSINLKKIIYDDEGNEYIEDLKITEKYSIDYAITIVPLVAPEYKRYGMYDFAMVDEAFINTCKTCYYEFIIAADGKVKMLFEYFISI